MPMRVSGEQSPNSYKEYGGCQGGLGKRYIQKARIDPCNIEKLFQDRCRDALQAHDDAPRGSHSRLVRLRGCGSADAGVAPNAADWERYTVALHTHYGPFHASDPRRGAPHVEGAWYERVRSGACKFSYSSSPLFLSKTRLLPATRADQCKKCLETNSSINQGASEVKTLAFAQQQSGVVQAAVAKPGMIMAPGVERRNVPGLPEVALREVAAALLHQALNGLEKDTLSNDDLVRIGSKALAGQ